MIKRSDSLIMGEMNQEEKTNWFDYKEKKFLHNIDTFYYSIKLHNDFTEATTDAACRKLRMYFKTHKDTGSFDSFTPFYCEGLKTTLQIHDAHYAGFYKINLKCPDMYDIFIADTVPEYMKNKDSIADIPEATEENNKTNEEEIETDDLNGLTVSVTSEIVVQIRSELLWMYGPVKAFEESYAAAKAVCKYFGLSIAEVKENRADYCWHSNYLQNPETFFRVDNFNQMYVTRLGRSPKQDGVRVRYDYLLKNDGSIENDYIAIGKRGDKCFLRIYHKSKEVVEMGKKGWFFKEWLFNGLISRYDMYCYEKCYKLRSWKYLTKARLEFYLEFGKDNRIKKDIRAILDEKVKPAETTVKKLADRLTPQITIITNVEFQTTRRMSKTYVLKEYRDNSDKGECKRVYDYLRNHADIAEYLTHETFRLVQKGTDTNKSRADYCPFWKALRSTRFVDAKKSPKDVKLLRDYTRKLDSEIIKKRAISATITYGLYINGINDRNVKIDAADLLCTLNDNDIEYMQRIKFKRKKQLNNLLMNYAVASPGEHRIAVIDTETGEFIT